MKELIDTLNTHLLSPKGLEQTTGIEKYLSIASVYAQVENAIAVLSDMEQNVSYIYYGNIAKEFGLSASQNYQKINSIWEEHLFTHISSEDLEKKYLQELYFLNFLQNIKKEEKTHYQLVSSLKRHRPTGTKSTILHRMTYLDVRPNGKVWLTLCLYNLMPEINSDYIINTANGQVHLLDSYRYTSIVSPREKEILQLIDKGLMSKEIADSLCISINTVNRHRQNILEKLNVDTSIEACRIAKKMKWIL